jgi:hypothetical protein
MSGCLPAIGSVESCLRSPEILLPGFIRPQTALIWVFLENWQHTVIYLCTDGCETAQGHRGSPVWSSIVSSPMFTAEAFGLVPRQVYAACDLT